MTEENRIKEVFLMFKSIIKNTIYAGYKRYKKVKQRFYVRFFPLRFIRSRYKKLFGKNPDLENPVTFSEKIQWLKLNYRDALMMQCADKVLVREYVKREIGESFLTHLFMTFNKPEEINFSILPNQFVLKPNNSSGRIIICKDKYTFNQEKAIRMLKKWERENLFFITGEWIYKDIPFRIICEEFLGDNLTDYKLYFSYDQFIATQVISDRQNGFYMDYYDDKWNKLNICRIGRSNNPLPTQKPLGYESMLRAGSILAKKFPFSRIDFYSISGEVYFGEISFFPNNGFVRFVNDKMDCYFADKIQIPPISR